MQGIVKLIQGQLAAAVRLKLLFVGKSPNYFEQEQLLKRGHKVQFLQLDDLEAVCQQANAYEPELFISLHANAHGNRQAQGTECYYYEESNDGELLAVCLQQALVATLQLRNRGVKTANFYVLTFTPGTCGLVELAFISNPYEENLLCTKQQVLCKPY